MAKVTKQRAVWVVTKGETGEGGVVIGVRSTQRKAAKLALSLGTPFEPWTPDGPNRWESGCDFVEIERHTVE